MNLSCLQGNLDNSLGLAKYAGPGGFNDLDMLEVEQASLEREFVLAETSSYEQWQNVSSAWHLPIPASINCWLLAKKTAFALPKWQDLHLSD